MDAMAGEGLAPQLDALDDQPFPQQPLEDYHKYLPEDLKNVLDQLVQDLEAKLRGSSRFSAAKITDELRQQVYQFITTQDLMHTSQHVLHELPPLEPDWELALPTPRGFLLRPPQPTGITAAVTAVQPTDNPLLQAAAGAAAAAGDGSSSGRQRVSKAGPGQQARNFNAYNSNKSVPISPGDSKHLVFITSPCKDLQDNQIGTYRGYVCADMSAKMPLNGHDWRKVKLAKTEGGVQPEAWVNVSVALGVWEPAQQPPRKRSRSASMPSPQDSLQGELLLPSATTAATQAPPPAAALAAPMQPPSAAIPLGMVLHGVPLDQAAAAAASAAAASALPAPFSPEFMGQALAGDMFGAAAAGGMVPDLLSMAQQDPGLDIMAQAMLLPAAQQQQLGAISLSQQQHILDPASASALHAAVMQPDIAAAVPQQTLSQHQLLLQQQHWGPQVPYGGLGAFSQLEPLQQDLQVDGTFTTSFDALSTQAGSMGMHPQAMQLDNSLLQHPSPAAAAALVPSAVPAAGLPVAPHQQQNAASAATGEPTRSDSLSSLVGQLQQLQLDQQVKHLGPNLLQAARNGGDLLECFMQHAGTAQQQEQEQQQVQVQARQPAQERLVQLLKGSDVRDDKERNVLHLVATHSFGVAPAYRHKHLDLLLNCPKLLRGRQSNGSTPLVVAAANLKSDADAGVFRRLLQAADGVVLSMTTKSGWSLLHCLANEATNAAEDVEGAERAALLQQLMREVRGRVREVVAGLAAQGTAEAAAAAASVEELCLATEQPRSRFYKGHRYMQQLQPAVLLS